MTESDDIKKFIEDARKNAEESRQRAREKAESEPEQPEKTTLLGKVGKIAKGAIQFVKNRTGFGWAGKYIDGIKESAAHHWDKYGDPVWQKIEPVAGPVVNAGKWAGQKSWGAYQWADQKWSFREHEEKGRQRDYLKTSLVAGMSLLTAFGAVTKALPMAFNSTAGAVTDGIYLVVGHKEVHDVYMFEPKPVEGHENLFRAKLCFDAACEHSTYVNFRENNALNIHSRLTNHFKPYRPVEEVERIMDTGSKCETAGLYGIQLKGRDWYQNVKYHNCKPLSLINLDAAAMQSPSP